MNWTDTKIIESGKTITEIEKIIKLINPERIYTHSTKDIHQDHRNLSNISLTACRNIPQIFFYESASSQYGFLPNYFINIEKYLDKKIKSLEIHKSIIEKDNKRYMEIERIKGGHFLEVIKHI